MRCYVITFAVELLRYLRCEDDEEEHPVDRWRLSKGHLNCNGSCEVENSHLNQIVVQEH